MEDNAENETIAVGLLKMGNLRGLETLVSLYEKKAAHSAFLITGSASAAQDVVQNAFIKAYRAIHQFDETKPFGPWFLRIVTNEAIKEAQRDERLIALDAVMNIPEQNFRELLLSDELTPEEQLEDRDQREAVWDALNKLSSAQRAAVVMRYFLEMEEADIASALGVARGTTKWYLHEARRHLRSLIRPGSGITKAGL